ncbi:MAG: methyltransferase domain-containing protein [Lachnospiraceae bacterium]|nr:methyltransferase domain-containing protein [Lachnospiraceae bacterium]MDE7179056.1 methyltransferase domain-containing protein [Lachnospiraceae bacterium]
MPSTINDYRQLVEKPWGKMFYDMIYRQLSLPTNPSLDILDFGAGFCVTANHYAQHHRVAAVEPNEDMLHLKLADNCVMDCIHGGLETLQQWNDGFFDLVICHNVLEYVPDKKQILQELARVLKQGGMLSIVKHNLPGRIFASAVFSDDPESAFRLLENGDNSDTMFGSRDTYSNEYLIEQCKQIGLSMKKRFGIRAFFSLSTNDDVKFTKEWYDSMLKLEMKACELDTYKDIAFFNHLLFRK